MALGAKVVNKWFKSRGWRVFPFQKQLMDAYENGQSGLLNAPTGSGKTLAVFMPAVARFINQNPSYQNKTNNGMRVLWITPLKALARDTQSSLQQVCKEIDLPWRVDCRNGDTSQKRRKQQLENMPECLITTPESWHLLLATKNHESFFENLDLIVVDEWHELLSSKRGVQVELAISRMRALSPSLKIWGISATIGNLEQAKHVLLGNTLNANSLIVKHEAPKAIEVISIIPESIEKFPWTGHLGLHMLDRIIPIIHENTSTLIFTNTRFQCEVWYSQLLDAHPELAGQIAMHHGSIEQKVRRFVEEQLGEGYLKAVVCTSSLDLGIDFKPVDAVVQIGGPKGVSRFLQRAGRSGHAPGAKSKIYFLPTHALELIEANALKKAVHNPSLEERVPVFQPMDVLVQYLITLSIDVGFNAEQIFKEVKNTYSYSDLTEEEYRQVLQFITTGGRSLQAYEDYTKVRYINERFHIVSPSVALRHRFTIGTIVSNDLVNVKYMNGKKLGTVEEVFITKLHPKQSFFFAGQNLQFQYLKESDAFVKKSKAKKGQVPSWYGNKMPLSSKMSHIFREQLSRAGKGQTESVEMAKLSPIFQQQAFCSKIPTTDELLIEYIVHEDSYYLYVYPFEGRLVHEGLAALAAQRIAEIVPISFTMAVNDYGFELMSDQPIPIEEALEIDLFRDDNLLADIQASLNATQMAKRRFRNIAAIAGLIFPGFPSKIKRRKHIQVDSGLIFQVYEDYEPNHFLLRQAYNEVFALQLEEGRMRDALRRIKQQEIILEKPENFTPFSFPIMVDRLSTNKLSSETLATRVERLKKKMALE